MVEFGQVKDLFFEELSQYYSGYPSDVSLCNQRIEEFYQENPGAAPEKVKAFIYKASAELCDIKLFRYCPFYYEIASGRRRNSGTSGFPPEDCIGAWLMRKNAHIAELYREWYKPYTDMDIIDTIMFVDFAHHCAGYDNVLKKGLMGIMEDAIKSLGTADDSDQREFLQAVIDGNMALGLICRRFSETAKVMAENEQEPEIRKQLALIAETAGCVPFEPPRSFYEALNTILFIREACISLDGIAVPILGHIDRMLESFYLNDIEKGILTRNEAKNLLAFFLAITDARFDHTNTTNGTNVSVVIGGCGRDGKPIFNEITKMVIEIFREYNLANPKLQARVSKDHPREYSGLLSVLVSSGANVLSILNDDVIIPSFTKVGKSLEDSRLYVAGGCQETVLQNTEVNCRAYIYINLLQVLRMTLLPEYYPIYEREKMKRSATLWSSFDEFYRSCFSVLKLLCCKVAERLGSFEERWREYSPCPLYSSTIEDCIKNRKDITAGGARYNNSNLALVGIGSFIDSLYAVKRAVFDDGIINMEQLRKALCDNFKGAGDLRQYLKNRIGKFGQDSDEINEFAAKVFKDTAINSSGMQNPRGGIFEASLFTFYAYDWLKDYTGATPDGRLDGQILSRGISPAETTDDVNIAKILHTVKSLDLTMYPGSGVVYLDMPLTMKKSGYKLYENIIHCALNAGIIALDFNIVDKKALMDAKKNPEQHRGLVVRVCGYSAYFVGLDPNVQDELIERVLRS
jgi:Pyruvate-formate lyase